MRTRALSPSLSGVVIEEHLEDRRGGVRECEKETTTDLRRGVGVGVSEEMKDLRDPGGGDEGVSHTHLPLGCHSQSYTRDRRGEIGEGETEIEGGTGDIAEMTDRIGGVGEGGIEGEARGVEEMEDRRGEIGEGGIDTHTHTERERERERDALTHTGEIEELKDRKVGAGEGGGGEDLRRGVGEGESEEMKDQKVEVGVGEKRGMTDVGGGVSEGESGEMKDLRGEGRGGEMDEVVGHGGGVGGAGEVRNRIEGVGEGGKKGGMDLGGGGHGSEKSEMEVQEMREEETRMKNAKDLRCPLVR